MVASSLVLAALLLQDGAGTDAKARRHDVADLVDDTRVESFEFELLVGPQDPVDLVREQHSRGTPPIEMYDLCIVVKQMVRASTGEDVAIGMDGDGLVVEGPEKVQAQVDAALAKLRAILLPEGKLDVRVFALDDDWHAVVDKTTLTETTAERQEQEWLASGKARLVGAATSPFVLGRRVVLNATKRRPIRRGVEVAWENELYSFRPKEGAEEDGLAACARVTRCDVASLVDLALRISEPIGDVNARTVEPLVWLVGRKDGPPAPGGELGDAGSATFHGKVPMEVDRPRHRVAGIAGSFLVPDQRVLRLVSRAETKSGVASFVVDLRVTGTKRSRLVTLAQGRPAVGATEGGAVAFVDLAAALGAGFEGPDLGSEAFGFELQGERGGDRALPSTVWDTKVALRGMVGDLDLLAPGWIAPKDLVPPLVTIATAGGLVVDGPASAVEKLVRADLDAAPLPPALELRGRLVDGETSVADFSLPVVVGRAATWITGITGAYLREWDVDVANETQFGLPRTGWYLDGLALSFIVSPFGEAGTSVAVRGVATLLDGPPAEVDLGNPYTPLCERVHARRMAIDEHVVIVGSAPIQIGGTRLALELSVVRR